ncbi:MAG: hypothetical protein NXI20_00740 [bacterium]|nr:hypothetical protein [bacterium]
MQTIVIITITLIGVVLIIIAQRKSDQNLNSDFKKAPAEIFGSIFYHEDDYRQVEIVPSENFNQLIKQATNIQDFSANDVDKNGYNNLYIREGDGIKLKQRMIDLKELDSILNRLALEKHTRVSTGITPGELISKNTYGYGQDYNGIFIDFESDIVTAIWITGSPEISNQELAKVLNEVGYEMEFTFNGLEFFGPY